MKKLFVILWIALFGQVASFAQDHFEKLGYGKWEKGWYADDFGDPMYDKPYIQTELKKKYSQYAWDFFYIRFSEMPRVGSVFEIIIGNVDSNYELYEGNATIQIKSSGGKVSTIIGKVSGGFIYLFADNAKKFAMLINSGNYKLNVSAHCYLDSNGKATTWSFSCTNETKGFYQAVQKVFGL